MKTIIQIGYRKFLIPNDTPTDVIAKLLCMVEVDEVGSYEHKAYHPTENPEAFTIRQVRDDQIVSKDTKDNPNLLAALKDLEKEKSEAHTKRWELENEIKELKAKKEEAADV